MNTVSKSEFARRLGVSKPRVSQLVGQGLPVLSDGKVPLADALAWVASHVDRSQATRRGGVPAAPAQSAPTPSSRAGHRPFDSGGVELDAASVLLRAKAKRALVDLRRAERLEKQQSGELTTIEDVKSAALSTYRQVRDGCQNLPSRCCAAIAAQIRLALEAVGIAPDVVSRLDLTQIDKLLAGEVRKLMQDLANCVEGAE